MAQRFFSITTEDKQSALDDAWDNSVSNNVALRASLRTLEQNSKALIQNGSVIMSSAGNGHASTAFTPGSGAAAPGEFAKMWRELINLFDRSQAWLVNPVITDGAPPTSFVYIDRAGVSHTDALPIAAPNDVQVDAYMRSLLIPITQAGGDYSALRTAQGMQFL